MLTLNTQPEAVERRGQGLQERSSTIWEQLSAVSILTLSLLETNGMDSARRFWG